MLHQKQHESVEGVMGDNEELVRHAGFLRRRPVYPLKVWQMTRQGSVDFTKHTLHWLALLLYTD